MSNDPCAECGDRTGSLTDNKEILVGGDVPALTFCSYNCLSLWSRSKAASSGEKTDGYTMIEDSETF